MTIYGNSPTLSTNTQPSHSKTGLGLLEYESSKETSERAEKKPRGKCTTYSDSQRQDTPLESMHQNTVQLVLYEEDLWIEIIISCVERIDKSTYWWH